MRRSATLTDDVSAAVLGKTRQDWASFDEVVTESSHFGHHAWQGRRDLPTLHLEDVSDIPFVSVIAGVEQYQHRARVRAFSGDLFASVTPLSAGYEPYCRDFLGLGDPHVLLAEPVGNPTAVSRACQTGSALKELTEWARSCGDTVLLHPYMAIHDVWTLAEVLSQESGAHVEIVGPTPPSLWVANDKGALAELIEITLGPDWQPRTRTSKSPEELAEFLLAFAQDFPFVGLKRTRCASAMGNAVFTADTLLSSGYDGVLATVREFLDRTEWQGDEEVLVVEWVDTHVSPSTQLWLPPVGQGLPILEGVYEQLLEGEEKVFLGSRPSTLPEPVNQAIGEASLKIATVFQALGYSGRCSFDFIVDGDLEGEFRPLFTECNGRWGGTSTPMYLVDRLVQGPRPHYHAQDFVHPDLVGASFEDIRKALASELFDPSTQTGRFVLYNVGPLAQNGKFDIISIGQTPEDAFDGIADWVPRLLGL